MCARITYIIRSEKILHLILVVVDDALVLAGRVRHIKSNWSLNPCFNGWYTRTQRGAGCQEEHHDVLILVLMDDALVRWYEENWSSWGSVLILVVMDDALVLKVSDLLEVQDSAGLNPCFNGWCTRTCRSWRIIEDFALVLILVLMDDALVLED